MERKIAATKRDGRGKNVARRTRVAGKIPGNLIGSGKSEALELDAKDFEKLLQSGLRQSSEIQLDMEGEGVVKVLAKEIQRHPVSGEILHVDLYRINPGQTLRVNVPVETKGFARGVKAGGALEHYIRQLRVRTPPESLKEKIEVDITNLQVGGQIHLKDLDIPGDWDVMMKGNPIICKIAQSRMTVMSDKQGGATEEAAES
ncbi:MAG: 50S ribosomal protein L25 [Spirochaetaceae bacterium]|nr:50S ribosomal protein L25 [Spirochaetaceae bacterium]|tara:strand:+ start:73524 stop:74129 length:606 start_codon:yes stop_codon:yes gene_type:complete